MSLNIFIILGPPGGGKGSLANYISNNLGYCQLSTGNLCRYHIANQTDIGKKIDFIIKSGKLIPDDLMSNIVEEWLNDNLNLSKSAFVFDGYPRTVSQAKILNELLINKFSAIKLNVVRLFIGDKVIISRLNSRMICANSSCQQTYSSDIKSSFASKKEGICDLCNDLLIKRVDDSEHTIKERLSVYNMNEKELLNYYIKIKQPIFEINSEQNIDKVFNDFKKLLIH